MRKGLLSAGIVLLCACSTIWTELRAAEVADRLLATPSYRARYVERGLLSDRPTVAVEREIIFQRPWKLRVQTLAPKDRAGDLYLYDGDTAIYWWPAELVGIRIRGLTPLDERAVRTHIKTIVGAALRDFAWSAVGTEQVLDYPAIHWRILPVAQGSYYLPHDEWRLESHEFVLKMDVWDGSGKPWYGFEFTQLKFDVPIADRDFDFEYPPNALVFDWDLRDAGITLEEAKKSMNFIVREPSRLPEGHKLHKIVKGRSQIPMLAMLMNDGAAALSLTQNRYAGGGAYVLAVGKPIKVGKATGYANFFGTTTALNWLLDGTELTLVGNLPFPEMVAIAEGVH
ncbi:MAG: LolA family protein [Nevskiales bacterium]